MTEMDIIIGMVELTVEDYEFQTELIDAIVELMARCYEHGQESILERMRPKWIPQ